MAGWGEDEAVLMGTYTGMLGWCSSSLLAVFLALGLARWGHGQEDNPRFL